MSEPGDATAQVTVNRAPSSLLSARTPGITYDGVTGRVLFERPAPGPASLTAGVMIGLHAGRYADAGLRWIYFLSGVAGSLMVASGLVLWTVKRREKLPDPARPHLGFRIVERLNVAVIGGFPLGIACFFWANRLLPVATKGRAEAEISWLFYAWAAAIVLALARRPVQAWTVLLGLTGVLLALLPVYNLFWTERGIAASIASGDWLPAGVDLTLLASGAAYVAIAWRVAHYRPAPRRRARPAPAAPAAPAAQPSLVGELEPAE